MNTRYAQPLLLALLAVIFTIGLTFATVELPYRVDQLIIDNLKTPDLDSRSDSTNDLQGELFIDHYNLRGIGYTVFFLMIVLIVAGFSTKKTGLAAFGAFAFILPVFAQFAGVMFFLAGLGVLNVLWMPLLDISFGLQELGKVIHLPYDILMYLGRLAGFNAYWYIIYFFIGTGLLVFFIGTYAWLTARAGKRRVAALWIYRFSRHPQYAGWIMWSYGVYLLLLLQRYPKRSWGISGSLPWLISTIFIIGVAMMEELRMLRQAGVEYRKYRTSAPMLFPMPRPLRRFFSLPLRLIYRKDLPERKREVVTVLTIYTVLLLIASAVFYRGGLERMTKGFKSPERLTMEMTEIADRLDVEQDRRARYRLADRLRAYGEPATDHFIRLLGSGLPDVRLIAIEALERLPGKKAVPELTVLLGDHNPDIRSSALGTLAEKGAEEAIGPMILCLDDQEEHVRLKAMKSLAALGSDAILEIAAENLESDALWVRSSTIDALGMLADRIRNRRSSPAPAEVSGAESTIQPSINRIVDMILAALDDERAFIRRRSVIALLRTGSERACDKLEHARGDEDWEVRVYADEVSRRLCR